MTPFYFLGGTLAVWALVVSAIGIMRESFPSGALAERVVCAISILLVAGALGAAIIGGATEEGEEEESGGEEAAALVAR